MSIRWLLALLAVLLLATPLHASAGHYYLEDTELIPPEIATELQNSGIQTTEQLLQRLLSTDDRRALAARVSLSGKELLDLARVIELMQVNGIGPRAARLLQAAGVRSVKDLAQRDSGALLVLVINANEAHQITGINPDKLVLDDWISKAASAPLHVK